MLQIIHYVIAAFGIAGMVATIFLIKYTNKR